jgi:hypothetical protein
MKKIILTILFAISVIIGFTQGINFQGVAISVL